MQQLTLEETARWLEQCEDACILIHQSPDGDCVGAGFALAEMLHQMGKRAAVQCSDPIPDRYGFLLPDAPRKLDTEVHSGSGCGRPEAVG